MKKTALLFFLVLLTSVCFAQGSTDDCGCDKLTKKEREQLSTNKKAEIMFSYPNGKIKYKEIKKGKRTHITCYQQTGDKCREIFLNPITKIKKTIYYGPEGKKYMVCKGNLKS